MLVDRFKEAQSGDYIVWQQESSLLFFYIGSQEGHELVLNEISAPISLKNRLVDAKGAGWKHWIAQGAPSATAWLSYTIDTQRGILKSIWCCQKGCFLDPKSVQGLLHSLLSIEWQIVPRAQRKLLGEPGQPLNERPLWNPKLYFEGAVIPNAQFDAFMAQWPKDGSPLAGLLIEIYLPSNFPLAPSYLPYWLQAKGKLGVVKLRAIDAGKSLLQ